MEIEPKKTEVKRNPDGTFAEGTAPGPGRNTGQTLKSYIAQKLRNMSAEEKEKWLEEHKISGIDKWKMAEGNPASETDITTQGEKLVIPILNGLSSNNSNKQDLPTDKKD